VLSRLLRKRVEIRGRKVYRNGSEGGGSKVLHQRKERESAFLGLKRKASRIKDIGCSLDHGNRRSKEVR